MSTPRYVRDRRGSTVFARVYTLAELEERWPRGLLHRVGNGRALQYGFFVPKADVPPQDEKLRLISHFAGTYLDHAGRTAPLQVCFGARTAGGWEPIG